MNPVAFSGIVHPDVVDVDFRILSRVFVFLVVALPLWGVLLLGD